VSAHLIARVLKTLASCFVSLSASHAPRASCAFFPPSQRIVLAPPWPFVSFESFRFVPVPWLVPKRFSMRILHTTHTCRAASFSSFISFSFAFIAAWAFLSSVRFSNEFWPALGRNAAFGACHCLPMQSCVSFPEATNDYFWCAYRSRACLQQQARNLALQRFLYLQTCWEVGRCSKRGVCAMVSGDREKKSLAQDTPGYR